MYSPAMLMQEGAAKGSKGITTEEPSKSIQASPFK
jgi:hypothetical protein